MFNREDKFYGLNEQESNEFLAWLNHDEAKHLWSVVEKMTKDSDRNALQTPSEKEEWNAYTGKQQRFIGEGIAFRKIANLKQLLGQD